MFCLIKSKYLFGNIEYGKAYVVEEGIWFIAFWVGKINLLLTFNFDVQDEIVKNVDDENMNMKI